MIDDEYQYNDNNKLIMNNRIVLFMFIKTNLYKLEASETIIFNMELTNLASEASK